ncbi:MAG TPA: phosphodiester glycosidase family protein, partial [Gemmatimonadales bacterium]|nr:phosphodiester glycosidase family protein [Gemmatimonadales bacterium]
WTINLLYVDLDACNRIEAVASSDSALTRMKMTAMLAALAAHETVLGGVNADFFSLTNGKPTNLLVINSTMRTPPIAQPVLAMDSAGMAHIGLFTLEHGALRPFHPMQAVGGRPVLARDSAIAAEVDSFGSAGFRGPNPRTAAGISHDGRRLVLAVIDGRTAHDAGMTLRQTAELMLALGARDAINLDGGGSTTMVAADSSGALRIVNHPSDREGERAVGDGLAVVRGSCEP